MREILEVARDLLGVAILIALGWVLFVLLPIISELMKG